MDNYKAFSVYVDMLEMAMQDLKDSATVCKEMTADELEEVFFRLYCVEEQARNIRDTLNKIERDR